MTLAFFEDDASSSLDSVSYLKTYTRPVTRVGALVKSNTRHLYGSFASIDSYHSRDEDTDYTISNGNMAALNDYTIHVASGNASFPYESDGSGIWHEEWIEFRFSSPKTIYKITVTTVGDGDENEVNGFAVWYTFEGTEYVVPYESFITPSSSQTRHDIPIYFEMGIKCDSFRVVPTQKLSYAGIDGSFKLRIHNIVAYGFSEDQQIDLLRATT